MDSVQRLLDRKLHKLELYPAESMSAAVADYYRRVPSGTRRSPRWSLDNYPCGSEKELYPEMAYAFLAESEAMVRALLEVLHTSLAAELSRSPLDGKWRAFRISTARPQPHNRYRGPRLFSGGAGYGGIADIGLFLNPTFDPVRNPCLEAQVMLYLELKSTDGPPHDHRQLQSHLDSLETETPAGMGYLAAIGGRPVLMRHPRWLGHTSLAALLSRMEKVAQGISGRPVLASEFAELHERRGQPNFPRRPNKRLQATRETRAPEA